MCARFSGEYGIPLGRSSTRDLLQTPRVDDGRVLLLADDAYHALSRTVVPHSLNPSVLGPGAAFRTGESERTPCCAHVGATVEEQRAKPRRLQRQPTRSFTIAAIWTGRVASHADILQCDPKRAAIATRRLRLPTRRLLGLQSRSHPPTSGRLRSVAARRLRANVCRHRTPLSP